MAWIYVHLHSRSFAVTLQQYVSKVDLTDVTRDSFNFQTAIPKLQRQLKQLENEHQLLINC